MQDEKEKVVMGKITEKTLPEWYWGGEGSIRSRVQFPLVVGCWYGNPLIRLIIIIIFYWLLADLGEGPQNCLGKLTMQRFGWYMLFGCYATVLLLSSMWFGLICGLAWRVSLFKCIMLFKEVCSSIAKTKHVYDREFDVALCC